MSEFVGGGDDPPPIVSDASTVVRVLEVLPRASTSPALVETGDGRRWVLKFSGAGSGPFGLLVEALALDVAAALGAPVPAATPLWLPADFPWMVGTDEFDSLVQRSAGWNLGVALLPDATPAGGSELAASPALPAIAAADWFLQNMDRRAANPNLLMAGGRLWAIDFDACLYLARALGQPRPPSPVLPHGHLLAGREAEAAPAVPVDFRPLVARMPADWVAAAGIDAPGLAARLDAAYRDWADMRRL